MEKRNYNDYVFVGLNNAASHLIQHQGKQELNEIKNELNKFFKDSTCEEVLFTNNTDKLFFGMAVYPVLNAGDVYEVMTGDEDIRVEKYYIEIDSKLLTIGITNRELVALMLHEIGHMVNDASPSREVRKAVDFYLAKNKTTIDLKNREICSQLFKFAVVDSFRKVTSIFTKNDDEILADEFVFLCGYGNYLESAFKKIRNSSLYLNKDVKNKLVALTWAFQVYANIGNYRLTAIRTLNSAKKYTGSKLEKDELDKAVKDLNTLDPDAIRECYEVCDLIKVAEHCLSITEAEAIKNNGLIRRIQINGLRGIEEDVFEYQMRINNVDDEAEAICLMRQINARMTVLDDYIMNATDLNDRTRERWLKVYDKYEALREELSKKTIYNTKNYGLWFDYNRLDAQR